MSDEEGSITEEIIHEHEFADGEAEVADDENEEHRDDEKAVEVPKGSDNEGNMSDAETRKKVVKPKRIVKNPQPKLNEQTIQGPRGIAAISSYFERVKFKGKGNEEQDLNVIMKTYEYWCHRLFPKFPFDASIERFEKLGYKRATKTHIKRIRHDLLIDDEKVIEQVENENGSINVDGFINVNTSTSFEDLRRVRGDDLAMETQAKPTEDQLARIRQNKERALQLRQENLRKTKERAEASLKTSNQLFVQIGTESSNMDIDIDNSSNFAHIHNIESPTVDQKSKHVLEMTKPNKINEFSKKTGDSIDADDVNNHTYKGNNDNIYLTAIDNRATETVNNDVVKDTGTINNYNDT